MYKKKYSSSLSPEQLAELQRVIEQYRKFLDSSVTSAIQQPFVNMSKLITSDLVQFAAAASKSISLHINQTSSLSKHIEAISRQFQEQLSGATDISKYLSSQFSSLASFNEVIAANFKDLVKSQEIAAQVVSQSLKLPSQRVIASLATMKSITQVYSPPPELVVKGLQLSNCYQLYASSLLKKASQHPSLSDRIVDVADAAGDFVSVNEIAVEKTLVLVGSQGIQLETDSVEFSHYPPNIFPMVNQYLSNAFRPDFQDKDIDIKLAIENSIPAQVNRFGCKLIELVYEINEYTQAASGEHIFKPTTKSMLAGSVLTSYVAQNEVSFAAVVDLLYSLVYEGSGSAKRLVEIVGRDNLDNLDPLWRLKIIRTHFRHDVEHGDNIPKKLLSFGEAFSRLIGKPRPTSTREWKFAQVKLYLDLIEMLISLLGQIRV